MASPSASASATIATGSHVLTVEGYSNTKDAFAVGDYICSGEFFVGGHSWHIRCYPCGFDKETANWVCVFLYRQHPAASDEVKVRFSVSLLENDGQPSSHYISMEHKHVFSSTTEEASGGRSISREELPSPLYLKNDSFRIRCDLTIVKEFRPADLPKPHQHLGNLLDGEVEGDMKFKVTGGETFTAHKYILAARSPVFMTEFFGPKNKETTTTTTMAPVKVINMDPRVFKALLHFIYTDELPEIDDDDSDRYEMERLKLLCDDVLWYHIDESTVVTWLQLADKHGCPRLKQPAPSSSVTSSKELLSDALNLLQRFKREPCLFFLLKIVN
ncbi:hypothetical protein QOZ80_9BG0714650 [Eleusine coracana subsp. coracana]|nr:hypothetical protein QOZ80_9BG0714650 [Eleusine coracana subsp. coracana]